MHWPLPKCAAGGCVLSPCALLQSGAWRALLLGMTVCVLILPHAVQLWKNSESPMQMFVLMDFKDILPRLYFAFKCMNHCLRGHIATDCIQDCFWSNLTFVSDWVKCEWKFHYTIWQAATIDAFEWSCLLGIDLNLNNFIRNSHKVTACTLWCYILKKIGFCMR